MRDDPGATVLKVLFVNTLELAAPDDADASETEGGSLATRPKAVLRPALGNGRRGAAEPAAPDDAAVSMSED